MGTVFSQRKEGVELWKSSKLSANDVGLEVAMRV
jgi:hypothetical protein